MTLVRVLAAVLATMAALAGPAATQEPFPSRLITIVVPLTPGTTIDILARLYAERLQQKLGQQVIVSNRAGAGAHR